MKSKKILVIGSSNTDMTVKSDRLPLPGETVLGGTFTMGHGGKGANQAVAAKRLGGDVSFVCKVGRDLFGKNSIENYNREGIDISHIMYSDKASGVALINVDSNAENSISVASGANMDLTPENIRKLEQVIRNSDILLLQLEIPVETVLEAARMASSSGAFVILNPAPACSLPDKIYSYVSLIVPNETEISQMTQMSVNNCESAENAAAKLMKCGVDNVIVTLGSKGSLICSYGRSEYIPSRNVVATDSTAAGDTFCGALCVALVEGKTLTEAAVFATVASSITVTRSGAQESIPYRAEVDEIIASSNK